MLDEHKQIMDGLVGLHLMVEHIRDIKNNDGRLFFIGNGGGAGHASHAAADFRKIAEIESYAWGENVSDLTAWANDTMWHRTTVEWLKRCNPTGDDGLFVFSVGGIGNPEKNKTSYNLWLACDMANDYGMKIMGITGSPGQLSRWADCQIVLNSDCTPVVEGIQSVLWHMIVNEV